MFFLGGGMSLRAKRKGAVEYCTGKRLTKKCIYEKKTKYLAQVSDTVEPFGYVFFSCGKCCGIDDLVYASVFE